MKRKQRCKGVKMFAAIVTVMIAVIMAGMVATIYVDHDATSEVVNWDGQR